MASPQGLLGKCFELSGIVPLAVFVIVHVTTYAGALFGASRFGATGSEAGLVMSALEILLVWLPLAFHGLMGTWIALSRLEAEPVERGRSVALRISGVLVAVFVGAHAVWFRWPLITGERSPEDLATMLAARLSSTIEGVPFVALAHLLGLAVLAVHLAVGVPRFVASFGLGSVDAARRSAAIGSGIVFLVGAATIVDFATGSALPTFLFE